MLQNADHKEEKQDNNVRYYTEHKEEILSRRISIRAQEKERMKMIFEERAGLPCELMLLMQPCCRVSTKAQIGKVPNPCYGF